MNVGRELYPELTGREARRQIACDRAEAKGLEHAMTRAEDAQLVRAFGPTFLPGDTAKAARAEQRRVNELVRRDRETRIGDALRRQAESRVDDGIEAAIVNTMIGPTPEWLSKGEVERYYPRQPDGTVAVVSTLRRMKVPVVVRMARKGQISDEAAKACRRYADTHEAAGLDGNIPSVNYGKEVFAAPGSRAMFTDAQGEAQSELRAMRKAIPPRLRRFFEAVTLRDVPVHRASGYARMRRSEAVSQFRDLAEAVAEVAKRL